MAPPHSPYPTPNNYNNNNNIWAQMSYTPPRGPCSQKLSMLTTCPCHRFMIHPLKAPTSFDCDGCGHHASFHQLASHEEEERELAVMQGWDARQGRLVGGARDGMMGREETEGGAKRRRIEGAAQPPQPPLGERRVMVGAFGEEDGMGEDEVVEIGVEEARRMVEGRREEEEEEEVLEREMLEREREEGERKAKGRKRKGR